MTNEHTAQRTAGFSSAQFRQAMGPGYQVATFREQRLLSEPGLAQPPHPARSRPSRRWSLLHWRMAASLFLSSRRIRRGAPSCVGLGGVATVLAGGGADVDVARPTP